MPRRRYHATPDRLGWALAGEAAAGGLAAMLAAAVSSGQLRPLMLAATFGGAALATLAVTVAIGLPLWLVLRRRADGPVAAALLGGAVGWLLLVAGQTGGRGFASPPAGAAALGWRWLSAAATASLLLPVPMLLALTCWCIAYRRIGPPVGR